MQPQIKSPRSTNWLKRLRLCPAVLALLFVAQFALLGHQYNHDRSFDPVDIDIFSDCSICSIAAGMSTPPEAGAVIAPVFAVIGLVDVTHSPAAVSVWIPSAFEARGPPAHLSA